ncbi:hypothetical protein Pint_04207 [Pistacia integerrima]|uniref:Uncharacterized protein n=1 Tax=Pistacia integerrima TaxID=434235 RepID=A0ACC0Z591_9ROSI|nr:hypothetical protein Pint_04207 [Pistacia integerrima]
MKFLNRTSFQANHTVLVNQVSEIKFFLFPFLSQNFISNSLNPNITILPIVCFWSLTSNFVFVPVRSGFKNIIMYSQLFEEDPVLLTSLGLLKLLISLI